MRSWTETEDATIRELYATKTRSEIAAVLSRTESGVRWRCWALGLNTKVRPWSQAEIDGLREAYQKAISREFSVIARYAAKIGRNFPNVSRKARSLGLTTRIRPFKLNPKGERPPKYGTRDSEAFRTAVSENSKRWIAAHGHPRGSLGMKHTPETKAAISAKSRARWADPNNILNSPEMAQMRSDKILRDVLAGRMRGGGYSRCKSGKRADIGDTYFRSAWEANYARYLNFLLNRREIVSWEYEPKTFVFEAIKRGNRAYTPDFLVTLDASGRHEWHEVKGWMDDSSRIRLERMAKFYPDEIVRVIGAAWFKQAVRGGLANVLPGWERG